MTAAVPRSTPFAAVFLSVGLTLLHACMPDALQAQGAARGLTTTPVPAGRRLAFVAGNNSYRHIAPLRNAVNDAVDLAAALRELRFTVELVTDASLEELERKLVQFAGRLHGGDVALFFFSGHAIQLDGENYLLATDFEAPDALAARRRSLSASEVLRQLGTRRPALRIVVLDACRDNPFVSQETRSMTTGLAQMSAAGTLIAFATAPGSTASDNPAGRNGLFTEHLLRNIGLPGRDAVDVLRQVQEDVYNASKAAQHPWLNLGYTGRFYFAGSPDAVAGTGGHVASEEEGFWQAASVSRDVKLVEEYLRRYGATARHAIPARLLLSTLRSEPPGAGSDRPDAIRRPSIAVLGFRNQSGRQDTDWISTALADNISSELAVDRRIRPIAGEDVGRMKRELSLPDTDTLAHDTLRRIKRNVNADVVILGSYLALGTGASQKIRLNVLVQETAGGSTLGAFSVEGTVGDGLFDVISGAGTRLRAALSLEPRTTEQAAMVRAAIPKGQDAAKLYAEGVAALRAFNAQVARDALLGAIRVEPSYALAHTALAVAWQMLGQDDDAVRAARAASTFSGALPLEQRLLIEARSHEMSRQWPEAISVYGELLRMAPDNLDYGLLLAQAHQSAGDARSGLATAAALRTLPAPDREDPRLDILAAECLAALSEFENSRAAAASAAKKGIEATSWLLVARARIIEANALLKLGRRNEARAAGEDAKRLYATAGDRRGIARALLEIGNNLRTGGNLQEAETLFREALVITRELGNRRHTARAANNVGATLFGQGKFAEAQAFFEQALAINREIGDRLPEATAINNVASALYEQGEVQRALQLDHQALAIRREIGDVRGIAMSLVNIAEATSDQGQLADARRTYEEAAALNAKIADDSETAYATAGLASVLVRQGLLDEARAAHETALRLRTKLGEQHAIGESRVALAELSGLQGNDNDAAAAVRELLDQAGFAADLQAAARGVLALSLLRRGNLADAEATIRRALQVDQSSLTRNVRFSIGLTAARIDAAIGRIDPALARIGALQEEAARLPVYRLVARLAEGEVRTMSGDAGAKSVLAEVEAEASRLGLPLIVKEARRLQGLQLPSGDRRLLRIAAVGDDDRDPPELFHGPGKTDARERRTCGC